MSRKHIAGEPAKRTHWEKRIVEWESSGQSQKAFCAERGLPLSTFQWWRARTKQRQSLDAARSFLPIAAEVSAVEVELRSKTRMRFEGEAALRAVEQLVARIK